MNEHPKGGENVALQGKPWDLSAEYPAADSPEAEADLARLNEHLNALEAETAVLKRLLRQPGGLAANAASAGIPAARRAFSIAEAAARILHNLGTYAHCSLSVDSQDEPAQALQGRLQALQKRRAELAEPLSQFLDRAPDKTVEAWLKDEATAPARFAVEHSRNRRRELLSLEEETLLAVLGQDGIHAWGRLYDQLAGTLQCELDEQGATRSLGLAAATALLQQPDEALRERAWRAINRTWGQHEETCAAALNAIAGWRLEECRKRSNGRAVHFLDAPLHANHIQPATLEAVLQAAREAAPLARRAALLQAKAYGKPRYAPWDLRAPAPAMEGADSAIGYAEALDVVARAYGGVDASMGEFVCMMDEKRWIEGRVGERKQPGAYSATFAASRTPRVYMTYAGGASETIILAHELGHAFHSWTMRDLPDSQRSYGMSIAETASTFGETVVRDALLQRAASPAAELAIIWEEASALAAFVLNIPTRFSFEKQFYEARGERPLRPKELKEMMSAAWRNWYGDSLAEPDPMFWASKLHFYISGLSFYNFPYLFGYLFSLGVYARREALGEAFFPRYRALLRDTGRMSAEALAAKHLDADLTQPEFWRASVAQLAPRIDRFEELVERVFGQGED